MTNESTLEWRSNTGGAVLYMAFGHPTSLLSRRRFAGTQR